MKIRKPLQFQLLVKKRKSQKDGVDIRINRFSDDTGAGNIKYTYNNGIIAKDEKLASMNFSTLEKLPITLSRTKKLQKYKKTCLYFKEVVNGTWSKESRLSELKTELAAVERKIQLSITPEIKQDAQEQAEKQNEAPKVQESIITDKGVHLPRGIVIVVTFRLVRPFF